MFKNPVINRILSALFTLWLISVISFIVIQLPPGDVVSNFVRQQELISGASVPPETLEFLRQRFGFGEPVYVQYLKWIAGFPKGDFGFSVIYDGAEVADIVARRIGMTLLLAILALFLSWGLAIPLGIYAATHKNRFSDYLMSNVALFGLSIPDFLMAVVYLFIAIFVMGSDYTGGLFSEAYVDAAWSVERFWDFLKHLAVPLLILSIGGMAGTFRIMRANLLDVLGQQFVETARAKGLRERVVIYKHAARIAINPLISRLGMQLPVLLNGTIIISIVLDLPTLGPPFYRALIAQDMYLAGTVLMLLAVILLIGNLIADLLLAWSDPRVRDG
ncbi:ABC transporter permease [Oceanomicrobium pacificus]|uniref:ABC transporter permease subunit n=1 Tax=Oceanomicrobium pacificus TaxID=2692916 RepID=A0A6B0TP68_9RHOB|nr:ABC transporter permease [Oceanomicrobium pacificus]MXU64399.1 ABC transporter permease subunit [Oceanomicrobium pacificus]